MRPHSNRRFFLGMLFANWRLIFIGRLTFALALAPSFFKVKVMPISGRRLIGFGLSFVYLEGTIYIFINAGLDIVESRGW